MTTKTAGRKPNLRSSIYEGTDGRWHGWVTMGLKDDGSPDRRHRTGPTEDAVTQKVRKLESDRDAGRTTKAGRAPTVAVWMSTYLDTVCERLVADGTMSPRTLDDYRSKTRVWIVPLLGQHRLDRMLPEHLDRAYAAMLKEGLSSSTVLKIHRILSRALKIAVRRDKVGRNVATLIDPPTAADSEIEPFTQEEARRILTAASERRNGARWSVALSLGLRQGEALGLRWSYIDLETGVIRAWFQVQRMTWRHGCADPHACGETRHRPACLAACKRHRHEPTCAPECRRNGHRCPRRTCPKDCTGHASFCSQRRGGGVVFRRRKGKSKLTLHCPPELLPILRTHRKAQAAQRLAAGSRWADNDLVFATINGTPIERSDDWREWRAILVAAAVRPGRLHDARHTAGTLLMEQGVHIRVVQEVLGHTRVTTTEKYLHVASPQAKDATERLGAVLFDGRYPSSPGNSSL